MATATGKNSRRKATKQRSRPGRVHAKPPPDDPRGRHGESHVDLEVGAKKEVQLHNLRQKALVQLMKMPVAEAEVGSRVLPTPGISNWVQLGPTAITQGQTYGGARVLVTGRVTAILVDPVAPNTLYVGTAQGGVWKTTDGGKNWAPKSDHEVSLAIGALAMDPTNHLVLYTGTGEGNFSGDSYYGSGVLKTTDGGNSWVSQGASTFSGARFCRIVVNPSTPNLVFAATTNGLFRSTNGGAAWAPLTNGLPGGACTDVAINPSNPNLVYAAFAGQSVYKTTNASAATPSFAALAGGLNTSNNYRIALAVSPSSPSTIYALIARNDSPNYTIDRFYRSANDGSTWSAIPLPGGGIGRQGFYNINVAIDPTTPDIVFLSGISVWKATRNPVQDTWTITEVGANIHPDNHAFAIDPTNHLVMYAGSDGGIYQSADGGATWSDKINEGPCITQFEFIDQHPTSSAMVIGGTQDNGTEMFKNSSVFHHADDGDGGFVAIDFNQPRNVLSTYYGPSPKRSTQGGKFGTWFSVSLGLAGSGLFYPPMALDSSNPNNIAFGTDRINLDSAQGTGGWPVKVTLPGIGGDSVSAVNYVSSNLIYAGTTSGKVYRLVKSGATWTATAIHAAPLPGRYIWDVATLPGDVNTVVVVMSGFGTAHVWRGAVPVSGVATWTDISGAGAGRLPDIPVNALAIDPAQPNTMYIASDIAVFRTTDGGATWTNFSQGLPNVAVFDLKLHQPTRLLRAATHGRGLWERKLDVSSLPDVNLYARDHVADTGRFTPVPVGISSPFEQPTQYVALGDSLWWWQCADLKVDALEGSFPSYQMAVADVDYLAFESKLYHRNARRGSVNRVYAQVSNRGIQAASNVTVKVLYANASAGLPPLPANFWTAFPGNSFDQTHWKPIGDAKVISALSPAEPAILEWDWSTPATAADHTCLLMVVDCASDPIPASNKIFDANQLVRNERHVGLKNLHVVNAVSGAINWVSLDFFGDLNAPHRIRVLPSEAREWQVGLLLPTMTAAQKAQLTPTGFKRLKPTDAMLKALREKFGDNIKNYDTSVVYVLESPKEGGLLDKLKLPKGGLSVMLLLSASSATSGRTVTILQQAGQDQEVIGGSTFVLNSAKPPGRAFKAPKPPKEQF